MTLYEFMPSLWVGLAFLFFAVFFLSDSRLFLTGCGGALTALCPSLFGVGIFVQAAVFFAYITLVYAACLLKRLFCGGLTVRKAIVLTETDKNGGYILYKGKVLRAYPRDRLYKYHRGDVITAPDTERKTFNAYRI